MATAPRGGCQLSARRPSHGDRATRWVPVVREAAKSWRPRHAVGASCPRGGQVMATAPRGGCQLSARRPSHGDRATRWVPVVCEAAKSWRPRHAVGASCPRGGQVMATAPRGGCQLSARRPSHGDRATRWVPVVREAAKSWRPRHAVGAAAARSQRAPRRHRRVGLGLSPHVEPPESRHRRRRRDPAPGSGRAARELSRRSARQANKLRRSAPRTRLSGPVCSLHEQEGPVGRPIAAFCSPRRAFRRAQAGHEIRVAERAPCRADWMKVRINDGGDRLCLPRGRCP
jgi:hypothetical protein